MSKQTVGFQVSLFVVGKGKYQEDVVSREKEERKWDKVVWDLDEGVKTRVKIRVTVDWSQKLEENVDGNDFCEHNGLSYL